VWLFGTEVDAVAAVHPFTQELGDDFVAAVGFAKPLGWNVSFVFALHMLNAEVLLAKQPHEVLRGKEAGHFFDGSAVFPFPGMSRNWRPLAVVACPENLGIFAKRAAEGEFG
jgi:hypothetical protein